MELQLSAFEFKFAFAFEKSFSLTEIRLAEVVEDVFVGAHLVADFGLALLSWNELNFNWEKTTFAKSQINILDYYVDLNSRNYWQDIYRHAGKGAD